MVGYDEVRVTEDNTISIRTAEYGDMGSITISGITFQSIPGFYTMNKEEMNKFLAEKSKPPIEGKSLLESAGISREDVEKVIQGSISYKGKNGQIKTMEAWIIIYKEYDRETGKPVTRIALVAENGWYAKTEFNRVEENPTSIKMQVNGFASGEYTPASNVKGAGWLNPDYRKMPEKIPLQ